MLTCKGNVFLSNIRMLIHTTVSNAWTVQDCRCQYDELIRTYNCDFFFLEVATDACIFKLPTQVVAS